MLFWVISIRGIESVQVSYSRLACFQRCRRRYFWSYIEGYRPIIRAAGQSAGDAGHRALALWYIDHDTESAIAKAREVLSENIKKADELESVLRRYFIWAREHDDFEMLSAEQEFTVALGTEHILYGITDGVLHRRDDTVWLLETKFNKQASTSHLTLDRQCSIYLLGFQHLNPRGVLYNVVRMTDGPTAQREPALRDYTFRSQHAIELTRRELICMANDVARYESLSHRQQLQESYANPNDRCGWDCAFYSTCIGMYDSGDLSALRTQFTQGRTHTVKQMSEVTRTLDVDV